MTGCRSVRIPNARTKLASCLSAGIIKRDGSTRAETGSSLDQISVVIIKNISRETFYKWRREEGWTQQPMQVPPGGWHPRPTYASLFTNTAETLEGFQLVRRELPRLEGFQLVRHELPGLVVLLAPDLNLFPILERRSDCAPSVTCGSRLFNIHLGDQPGELFEPPSDAAMTAVAAPGGIIRRR